MITICTQCKVNANLLRVLSVYAELDLFKLENLGEMAKLREFSDFRWLIRWRMKMPLTFKDRETIILGYGTVVPDSPAILITFRNAYDTEYAIGQQNVDQNYEKFEVKYGFYHIKYIDENNCLITSCYNIDPNMKIIPNFLLNVFLKEIGCEVMRSFKKQFEQNTDAEIYAKRMEENKHFYDKILNRLKGNNKFNI